MAAVALAVVGVVVGAVTALARQIRIVKARHSVDDERPPTVRPAADLPAADLPAADLPAADLPAADLPTADLPAADLPAPGSRRSDSAPPTASEESPRRASTTFGATRIFVCYRRADSEAAAGRLYDGVAAWRRDANVFMDVDSVPYGHDFVDAMLDAVRAADLVLAVIGPNWLGAESPASRRIDDPQDNVRLELAAALRLGKRIVPVLVGGAEMPRAADLPASLAALARRNAFSLRHATFHDDLRRLLDTIDQR
jgi:hypothetical protein